MKEDEDIVYQFGFAQRTRGQSMVVQSSAVTGFEV
jgi:hypothetical protein